MLPKPIWFENNKVMILDQTKLPENCCKRNENSRTNMAVY